jgi:hypothetical protein
MSSFIQQRPAPVKVNPADLLKYRARCYTAAADSPMAERVVGSRVARDLAAAFSSEGLNLHGHWN